MKTSLQLQIIGSTSRPRPTLPSQEAGPRKVTKAVVILVRSSSVLRGSSRYITYPLSAMRQTWEEIGLDLAERDFTCVGQLDDREITTSLGKRLLMILSPFGMILGSSQANDIGLIPTPDISSFVQCSFKCHPHLLRLIPSRGRPCTGFHSLPYSPQNGRLFRSTALRDLRRDNPCSYDVQFGPLSAT